MASRFDVAVIGAGAAGMMCAGVAGRRGRSVVLVDHAAKLAEKIRISGGGRCNFTNRDVGPANFLSDDPGFARAALAAYASRDFVALVDAHRIRWHEKHRGQLFCHGSSDAIIRMLAAECDASGVRWMRPVRVAGVASEGDGFRVETSGGTIAARRVVVATGGLSIPKIGATDFAYRTARAFGIAVVEPRPGLVPLTFEAGAWASHAALAGLSLEVDAACGDGRFRESLLFTHRGLSGPAALQVSTYWHPGAEVLVDLAPGIDVAATLRERKRGSRQNVSTVLAEVLPRRLALERQAARGLDDRRIAEVADASLASLAAAISGWRLHPSGTEGFRKAEVTAGGIATAELAADSLASRRVPGLHFIGEAVDVTGWLGGYNFQWAWSSGVAAGRAV